MEKERKIAVGMTSFGMSGLVFHGPLLNVHPGFHLKSVLQRSKDTAREKYKDIEIVRTIEDLVQDPALDLVIVNATNDTHFSHAKMALAAGMHVLTEKPLAPTVEGARRNELKPTIKKLAVAIRPIVVTLRPGFRPALRNASFENLAGA